MNVKKAASNRTNQKKHNEKTNKPKGSIQNLFTKFLLDHSPECESNITKNNMGKRTWRGGIFNDE
jgi:hypothetical protein